MGTREMKIYTQGSGFRREATGERVQTNIGENKQVTRSEAAARRKEDARSQRKRKQS
jgi:hypothetical protein